jgi:hypothetical protein
MRCCLCSFVKISTLLLQVGLFFQDELTAAAGGTAGIDDSPASHPMPVLLLSEDRAQLSLARSHGLPAARLSDLSSLPAALAAQQPLSSSLLRRTLAPAATTGNLPSGALLYVVVESTMVACLVSFEQQPDVTQHH